MDLRAALLSDLGEVTRVDAYALPVARFCHDAVTAAAGATAVVGISGPQGSGKSTLAGQLVRAFGHTGVRAVAVSIDDFYLTHQGQRAVAAAHPDNPYLEHRGYPGTHDVALGAEVLCALASRTTGEVRVPAYDKGAFGGRGDRAAAETWPRVALPVDLVLLEGWMLGFRAVSPEALEDAQLAAPNARLPAYEAWLACLGALVHLDAPELAWIVDWRVDAERTRRHATGAGLSDDDARDYIERFLPAYRTYLPGLRRASPVRGPVLRIELAQDRRGRA
jgi:D-glycerate 3-kinase